MVTTSNAQVIFVKQAIGDIKDIHEHLKVVHNTIDLDAPLAEGEFLIKQLVFSIDVYMYKAITMPPEASAGWGLIPGDVMKGATVGRVLRSNNPDYAEEDIVLGGFASGLFSQYAVISKEQAGNYSVRKDARSSGIPLTHYISILGLAGITAYFGLFNFGKPKASETIYVSSAAGGVGQAVGQFAKVLGLRVLGSAGSDEKVQLLKKLGYDDAFNYKTADWDKELDRMAPNGIDIDFELVGGKMLNTVMDHLNFHGRVLFTGAMSQETTDNADILDNVFRLIQKRLTIFGVNAYDVTPEILQHFDKDVTQWLKEGKIVYEEDISVGIETIPQAIADQVSGATLGKKMVSVADI